MKVDVLNTALWLVLYRFRQHVEACRRWASLKSDTQLFRERLELKSAACACRILMDTCKTDSDRKWLREKFRSIITDRLKGVSR